MKTNMSERSKDLGPPPCGLQDKKTESSCGDC